MTKVKVDNYTKAVLTIIAICLTVLTLKQFDIITKAYAMRQQIMQCHSTQIMGWCL